jgi:hypothetical protein
MTYAEKINAIAELIVAGASRAQIENAMPGVTIKEIATAALVAFSSGEAYSDEQVRADFADRLIELLK